jgi:hypothetical protein
VLLANYLKHNKDVFKEFKAHLKNKTKKDSNKEANGKLVGKKRKQKEESDSSSSEDSESSGDEKVVKKNGKADKRAKTEASNGTK